MINNSNSSVWVRVSRGACTTRESNPHRDTISITRPSFSVGVVDVDGRTVGNEVLRRLVVTRTSVVVVVVRLVEGRPLTAATVAALEIICLF